MKREKKLTLKTKWNNLFNLLNKLDNRFELVDGADLKHGLPIYFTSGKIEIGIHLISPKNQNSLAIRTGDLGIYSNKSYDFQTKDTPIKIIRTIKRLVKQIEKRDNYSKRR